MARDARRTTLIESLLLALLAFGSSAFLAIRGAGRAELRSIQIESIRAATACSIIATSVTITHTFLTGIVFG